MAAERAAAIKEHFAALDRDPKLRRQREAKQLRHRFGIGYVESERRSASQARSEDDG